MAFFKAPEDNVCHFLRLPTEIRFEIYRYLVTVAPKHSLTTIEDESHVNREMAILRTKRQIHEEAASVLYSELTIMLFPGHLLGLKTNEADSSIFKEPIKGVWRHDPLRGTGYTKSNGSQFYYTPEMDGFMEPHVFARFKKIELHIAGRFLGSPALLSTENFRFEPTDEAYLTHILTSTTLMKSAANLLSNSPLLNNLSVYLDIKVDLDDGQDDNGIPDQPSLKQCYKLLEAAQERAVKLLIKSKALEPLQGLLNARRFKFAFIKYLLSKEDGASTKLVDVAEDLKYQIEENWAMKAGGNFSNDENSYYNPIDLTH